MCTDTSLDLSRDEKKTAWLVVGCYELSVELVIVISRSRRKTNVKTIGKHSLWVVLPIVLKIRPGRLVQPVQLGIGLPLDPVPIKNLIALSMMSIPVKSAGFRSD